MVLKKIYIRNFVFFSILSAAADALTAVPGEESISQLVEMGFVRDDVRVYVVASLARSCSPRCQHRTV